MSNFNTAQAISYDDIKDVMRQGRVMWARQRMRECQFNLEAKSQPCPQCQHIMFLKDNVFTICIHRYSRFLEINEGHPIPNKTVKLFGNGLKIEK